LACRHLLRLQHPGRHPLLLLLLLLGCRRQHRRLPACTFGPTMASLLRDSAAAAAAGEVAEARPAVRQQQAQQGVQLARLGAHSTMTPQQRPRRLPLPAPLLLLVVVVVVVAALLLVLPS
jgi:hypothetical protein